MGRVGLIGLVGMTMSAPLGAAQSVQALPPCAQKFPRPPAAWLSVDLRQDGVRFRVPPGTVRQASPRGTCSHGCEDWTSAGLTVRRIKGTWGESSFADALEQQRACVLRKAFVTIVLVRNNAPRSMVVWPVPGGRPTKDMTSILEIAWTEAAAQRADAVLGSIEPN